MRHAVTLALALLVGTCAACGTAPPPPSLPQPEALAKVLEQRAVALVTPDVDGAFAYCSGVWVAPGAFLTANHCLRGLGVKDTVTYVTRPDVRGDTVAELRVGVLVARDSDHDLSLVSDPHPPIHTVSRLSSPVVGKNAFTMGHPLGLWWSYSQGQVAAIRLKALGEGEAVWWVQATAPVSPGNSGGGLFDEDGNLIGLCHALFPHGENVNFFIHPDYIRTFLATEGIR